MVNDKSIWLPPNQWVDVNSGALLNGSTFYNRSWDLSEIPILAKAGAIIPKRYIMGNDVVGTAQRRFDSLLIEVF